MAAMLLAMAVPLGVMVGKANFRRVSLANGNRGSAIENLSGREKDAAASRRRTG